MIKNKSKKKKKKCIQERKEQLSGESNFEHLQGRSAPRPLRQAVKDIVYWEKLLYLKYYFREILLVEHFEAGGTVSIMNSKIYLRKISYNYFLLLLTFRPPFFSQVFFCFVRTGYSSHNISDNSSSLDLSKTLEPR